MKIFEEIYLFYSSCSHSCQSLDNSESREMLKLFILLASFYFFHGLTWANVETYVVLDDTNFEKITEKGNVIVIFLKDLR